MNIKQAKAEITNTIKAYLSKDELGNYAIPSVRQRPVLLMGPPGIGKTQIMEQIAHETGIGLCAYTITHHTRQSAIGLPFIEHRNYGGEDVTVTEYTMSEILASVYSLMEKTGLPDIGVTMKDGQAVLVAGSLTNDMAIAKDLRSKILKTISKYNSELPHSQQIHDVIVRKDALPRTATGKLKRHELQEQIECV